MQIQINAPNVQVPDDFSELIERRIHDVLAPFTEAITRIEVVPIRQMTGGSSFSEVFFTDARVPDSLRIGEVGKGWGVALTMLGHERGNSSRRGARKRPGGSAVEAIATARAFGKTEDPVIRQKLAQAYIREQIRLLTAQRATAMQRSGGTPGSRGRFSTPRSFASRPALINSCDTLARFAASRNRRAPSRARSPRSPPSPNGWASPKRTPRR